MQRAIPRRVAVLVLFVVLAVSASAVVGERAGGSGEGVNDDNVLAQRER